MSHELYLLGRSFTIKIDRLASPALFVLTFLLYLFTLAPGVYGFDSAELATGVYTQGITHPPGFPLYLLLGKLFSFLPVGDLAYRLNIMSAVFASLTIVILYKVLLLIVESHFIAWISALLLATSYYFWQMALVAEVYTIFTTLIVVDLLFVCLWRRTGARKFLLLFSFFYGLTLTIHTSGSLFAPAFSWLILSSPAWKKTCWRWTGLMFLLFLLGLSLYAYLVIRAGTDPLLDYSQLYPKANLTSVSGFFWFISGKAYSFFAFGYSWSEISSEISRFIGFLWRNYLGIGVPLGLIGIFSLSRKNPVFFIGIALMFAANSLFYINYRVMDKDTMFLPAYIIWVIFVAVGLHTTLLWLRQHAQTNSLRNTYSSLFKVLQVLTILSFILLNWRWVDMSHATGYASFARAILSSAPQDSVILSPWSSAVVIEYFQIVEGMRPDLTVINQSRIEVAKYSGYWDQGLLHEQIMAQIQSESTDFIQTLIRQHHVIAIEYNSEMAQVFDYIPEGPVFRLALR